MNKKSIELLKIIFALLMGALICYVIIANPFSKKDNAGIMGCQYTSCQNKVIVENNGISEAVKKVYDAVVMVENFKANTLQGTGSGVIYKTDKDSGYIMTNYHVIDNSNSLKVLLTSGKEVDAKLLGGDEYIDIAILTIPVSEVKSVVEIGKTSEVELGDFVFTIGSPVGKSYFNSITSGIISGLNREVTVSVKSTNDWVMNVIQVDAAINPGNSGGPLLNGNGELIGINSMKLVDNQIEGMGFAIKVEDAMAHVEEMEAGKKIDRPLLGISLIGVNDTRQLYQYGITKKFDIDYGVLIVEIAKGTGASQSDLKEGDIITSIENEKVTDAAYLKYILYKYNVGDTIKVGYQRNGKQLYTKVKLTKN